MSSSPPFRLSARQLECLSSPVRAELMERLTRAGQASVSELAGGMGRSSQSLYHHLRLLQRAGLVRQQAARRATGGREAVVFRPVDTRFALPRGNTSAQRRAATRAARSILRKADREHTASREAAADEPALARWMRPLRVQARLSEKDARELTERLAGLGQWLREHDRQTSGRLYSLTALFTSVVEERC